MTLGETIRHLRREHGISQEALAEQLEVSRQAVSKWEKGLSFPSTENLLTLAALFEVSADELAGLQNGPSTGKQEEVQPEERSETATQPETPAPRRGHRKRWAVCLVLGVLLAGGLLLARWGSPVTPGISLRPAVTETGEFALLWEGGDGWEFLSLGAQEEAFPFGTSLSASETEQVFTGDNGETYHTGLFDGVQLTYAADAEGAEERQIVDRMAVVMPDYETPRDIRAGSDEAQVLEAYADELVYCLKESSGDILCPHDYFYAYSPEEDCGQAILFYMKGGKVAGLSVESSGDMGSEAYQVDNQSVFPLRDGAPDFGAREEPELETMDATRAVYIAYYALETDENLSEEEKYQHRQTIYENLQYMSWQAYGTLGEAGQEDHTREALTIWLGEERSLSKGQLRGLLLGSCRSGSDLDGYLADNYCDAMARTFLNYPESLLECLEDPEFTHEEREGIVREIAYGATASEDFRQAALAAAEGLEGRNMFGEKAYDGWKSLLELLRDPPF